MLQAPVGQRFKDGRQKVRDKNDSTQLAKGLNDVLVSNRH